MGFPAIVVAAAVACTAVAGLAAPAAAECRPVLADTGDPHCANDCDDNVYQQLDRRLGDALPDTICTQ